MVNSRNKKHKRRKDNRQSTVLQHYFLTYFTVLFIPLLICSLYYIRMLSLLSEDDSKARESELEHAAVLNTWEIPWRPICRSIPLNGQRKYSVMPIPIKYMN